MNDEISARHKTRMARKKEVVDAAIARAQVERGLLLVHTGNGKGKSSSAFGMVARALGHGLTPAVAQFIKSQTDTGEEAFFQKHGVEWIILGEGFTWETQNLEKDQATAQKGWEAARKFLADPTIDLVVLDELTYPIKYGWLEINLVLSDIQKRPKHQHVIITGRGATDKLIEAADTVTEFRDEKHAFRAGIKAQKGIDL